MRKKQNWFTVSLTMMAIGICYLFLPSQSFSQTAMKPDTSKMAVKTAAEAKKMVVLANRILSNEGVLDALGHVSLRNPENPKTFFQSRALAPFEVTEDDIIEIDLDGNIVSKPPKRGYSERYIHATLLKARPDMNAVFHGHHASLIPFTVTNVPLRPICHVGSFLYQGVPVYDDYEPGDAMLIKSNKEGMRIAKQLGQSRAILLRGHGVIIVAESLPRAVASAIYISVNANIQWQTLLMGKEPKYLEAKEAKEAMEVALFGDSPLSRMWGLWLAKTKAAMQNLK